MVFLRSVRLLLVTANVVPSSPSILTLMIEAILSSETSVLTEATRHNIAEKDGILQERIYFRNFFPSSPSILGNKYVGIS
jgi:hypothetical protein